MAEISNETKNAAVQQCSENLLEHFKKRAGECATSGLIGGGIVGGSVPGGNFLGAGLGAAFGVVDGGIRGAIEWAEGDTANGRCVANNLQAASGNAIGNGRKESAISQCTENSVDHVLGHAAISTGAGLALGVLTPGTISKALGVTTMSAIGAAEGTACGIAEVFRGETTDAKCVADKMQEMSTQPEPPQTPRCYYPKYRAYGPCPTQ